MAWNALFMRSRKTTLSLLRPYTIAGALILLVALNGLGIVPSSGWADYDGTKIHYLTSGTGNEALVFIHGWACDATFWSESIDAFPGRRVIAVDLPGHGKSDQPQTDYTMPYFAGAVDAVLKHAGVDSAVLAGHSMGTPVVRQFYRSHPERVQALVVVDGAMRTAPREEMEAFVAPLRADYATGAANFVDGMLGVVRSESLKKRIREQMLSTPGHVGLGAMEGMIRPEVWREDPIEVPVLAVMAKSEWWQPDESEYFQNIAPDLTWNMWEGYSHFLMMENPGRFNSEMRCFLDRKNLLIGGR